MISKFKIISFLLMLPILMSAQWTSINPGAGGQVQDVVCDPNIENRLYLASDMEGIYVSDDNGNSWHPKGDLLQNRVYAIAVAPGNSKKMFVGTLYGLEVSEDGGENFSLVEITRKKSIGAIAVNPNNPEHIIAGLGWRDDLDFSHYFGLQSQGRGELFQSLDGGKTWETIIYEDEANTNRNVLTIQYHPTKKNIVYIGASKGIYKSEDAGRTWKKLKAPENTTQNWGAALSPNGEILYATYAVKDNKGYVYATPTSTINWEKINNGEGIKLGMFDFWYPEVDPRSTEKSHKLIVGLQHSREGLFEATLTWDNNKLLKYSWETIWSGVGGFDTGWDYAHTNPRFVHYTPKNWKRAIWSTTNQTIFEGIAKENYYQWNNKYCIPNFNFQVPHWESWWPTYSSRGTESTYTYDITADKNYVLQAQGDNGFVESWDYGKSWSNIQHRNANMNLSDVQSVAIAQGENNPIVIAQATGGYGGAAVDGRLYIKELKTHTPNDKWIFLAGGPDKKGGMPSGIYRDIAVSPIKQNRVFAFSSDNGLYMIDDIDMAIGQSKANQKISFEKISNGVLDKVKSVKKISPHPTNENIVFLNATTGDQGVYKGEKDNGSWKWSKIYNGSSWDAEVDSWEHNGQVYLFFSGESNEKHGDGKNFIGVLSLDEGKTWKVVFTKEMAMELKTNKWYKHIKDDYVFSNKGGILGFDNHIIMSYYHHRMQKAYGIFKGSIDSKGNVTWEDYTGDIGYGGLTSAVIKVIDGHKKIFVSTAGAGAWMREE
ncbi:hypothetical protein HX109_11860 [Galbibacter sp. BG1]|uniref:VPS10 domain-containing protein n=1 Tax=Galbibacter sp. BG1 TaxID=1170699 RepID=UPI0015BC59A0|nr:hypothetical protein [Galbibacter sp. BG1]QLE02218.1 hypothetical protein HX109_11860 [Galbibacter sp. BG1]